MRGAVDRPELRRHRARRGPIGRGLATGRTGEGPGRAIATFELELDDGSVIRGAADEGVLPQLEDLFGQTCVATIVIRELRLHTGETKEAHRLTHLAP